MIQKKKNPLDPVDDRLDHLGAVGWIIEAVVGAADDVQLLRLVGDLVDVVGVLDEHDIVFGAVH